MAICKSCNADLPIGVRFCSSCGAPVGSDEVATLEFATAASPHLPRPASSSSRPPSSTGFALNEGRFLPGRLLVGRYRIIVLPGKGEVDGHSFFTMEYVDGEDLASRLRRIGRLPQDKATDIAPELWKPGL